MKNLKNFFILFLIISISGINSYSQNENQGSLELKIKVINPRKNKIDNAIFKVYENDKEIKIVEGNPCIIALDLNKDYIIEMSENKNIKHITVKTSVPEKFNDKNYQCTCRYKLYDLPDSYEKPSTQIIFEVRNFIIRPVVWGISLAKK